MVTKVVDTETYQVKYRIIQKNGEIVEQEEEFGFGRLITPRLDVSKSNHHIKDFRDFGKFGLVPLLLNDRDKEMGEVFEALCDVLTSSYKSVLRHHDGELYFAWNNGTNTACILSVEIIQFLSAPRHWWKVCCYYCGNNKHDTTHNAAPHCAPKGDSTGHWIWFFCTTIRKSIIERASYNANFRRQLISPLGSGRDVNHYCDRCWREILEDEYYFECTNRLHILCLMCFRNIVAEYHTMHALLPSLLNDRLNDDCIFEIISFVKGYNFFYQLIFINKKKGKLKEEGGKKKLKIYWQDYYPSREAAIAIFVSYIALLVPTTYILYKIILYSFFSDRLTYPVVQLSKDVKKAETEPKKIADEYERQSTPISPQSVDPVTWEEAVKAHGYTIVQRKVDAPDRATAYTIVLCCSMPFMFLIACLLEDISHLFLNHRIKCSLYLVPSIFTATQRATLYAFYVRRMDQTFKGTVYQFKTRWVVHVFLGAVFLTVFLSTAFYMLYYGLVSHCDTNLSYVAIAPAVITDLFWSACICFLFLSTLILCMLCCLFIYFYVSTCFATNKENKKRNFQSPVLVVQTLHFVHGLFH
ncbi:hypothetical protein RFI_08632 [Reticulomyxa filosa]|uniref:Uncharacterized protein n=1 Tax=Reticulomyxa filosa TaxID=46433 RepID=X6NRE8_RETFI|nr:hypothetical protein RFI_08632 [Reticulomyxa filosa]|eukprot:ETO28498.1 hypothetical protein RFI_08632 [Reticulomyxa filosa]